MYIYSIRLCFVTRRFRHKAALEITAVLLFKMSRLHVPKQNPSSGKGHLILL